jgi:hypothetical protein
MYQIRRNSSCHCGATDCVLQDESPPNHPCHSANAPRKCKPISTRWLPTHLPKKKNLNPSIIPVEFFYGSLTLHQRKCKHNDKRCLQTGTGWKAPRSKEQQELQRCRQSERKLWEQAQLAPSPLCPPAHTLLHQSLTQSLTHPNTSPQPTNKKPSDSQDHKWTRLCVPKHVFMSGQEFGLVKADVCFCWQCRIILPISATLAL